MQDACDATGTWPAVGEKWKCRPYACWRQWHHCTFAQAKQAPSTKSLAATVPCHALWGAGTSQGSNQRSQHQTCPAARRPAAGESETTFRAKCPCSHFRQPPQGRNMQLSDPCHASRLQLKTWRSSANCFAAMPLATYALMSPLCRTLSRFSLILHPRSVAVRRKGMQGSAPDARLHAGCKACKASAGICSDYSYFSDACPPQPLLL